VRTDPTLSARCRAQHGMPHRPHTAGCTGCSCTCHAVRPPANFRQIAYAARDAARSRAAETSSSAHPLGACDVVSASREDGRP
jgi:hypothetical protein